MRGQRIEDRGRRTEVRAIELQSGIKKFKVQSSEFVVVQSSKFIVQSKNTEPRTPNFQPRAISLLRYCAIFSCFLLLTSFIHLNAEVTFEPYAGYNLFSKIGNFNRLIDNYSSTVAQFSEIKGGWDFGGKLGLEIYKNSFFLTSKVSYLSAQTGLIYMKPSEKTIVQRDLNYYLGFPDNFKISLLTGQVGLALRYLQTQKVTAGIEASGGQALCTVNINGSGKYYIEGSTVTYTFNAPYEKQANIYELALNLELHPFGIPEKKDDYVTAFPMRSTSIIFTLGQRFANIGPVKATRNLTDSRGNIIVPAETTLKDQFINAGNDLNLDLSNTFFNVGLLLRW